jgi:two-component system CheB/CheR fusion protein
MDRIYDEQSQLYLKKMEVQINRLTDLVSDLLDVSRIQAGKLELHKEHFQFDEMVKSVTDNLAPVLNNHSIEIQKNESVTVYADRSRLEQVLINLITNAVKYSPGVDKIIIRIEKKKGFIRTSVHDFGIGIPKDKQKKIFDRFYRVKGPRGERFQGLGLGLYISAEIVRRHDGEISFESTEGKGSIFYFTLPL